MGEAETGVRTAIMGVLVAGIRQRSAGAIVNGVLALAAAHLPAVVERQYAVDFRPWQRLYVESALLTHAVGMLGPYDDTWWWDHLTHTHSATIVGGIAHVAAQRRDYNPRLAVLTSVFTTGVLWELVEYVIHSGSRRIGLEPVLVSYGRVDTALDLVFDLLGAGLVLAFGGRLLGNLVGRER